MRQWPLHQLKMGENDWDQIPDADLTYSQKIAKKTKSLATLANLATTAGFGTGLWGAYDIFEGRYISGITKVVASKALDVIDGGLAEIFKVKSRFGKGYDAAADALGLGAAVAAMEYQGLIPSHSFEVIAGLKLADLGAVALYGLHADLGAIQPTTQSKFAGNILAAGVIGTAVNNTPQALELSSTIVQPLSWMSASAFACGIFMRAKTTLKFILNAEN